jgi:CheY-like chemotaxis protein
MNIAVVDDEAIVQRRLKGALEKEGHRVDAFASGEDLLRQLEGAAYDLVFLDVVLRG